MYRAVLDSINNLTPNKTSEQIVMVMLPGAGMCARDFMDQGFVSSIQDRGLAVDVVMADIAADDYLKENFNERLKNEVVEPLIDQGYRRIWFVGISLGAYGAIKFLREKIDAIEGVMLLSPFLSTRGAVAKVLKEGGLVNWSPCSSDIESDDWDNFCWLKENLAANGSSIKIYVGWGDVDRYADSGKLLADHLPQENVFRINGDHDWHTWNTLWHCMLDVVPFPSGIARQVRIIKEWDVMTSDSSIHSLQLVYASQENFASLLDEYKGRIFGVLVYSASEPVLPQDGFPCAWVALPVIGDEACYEVWISAQPVTIKGGAPLCLSSNGGVLFGSLILSDPGAGGLESMVRGAYSAIFDAMDKEGYPNLLRVWNYLARINDEDDGLERYREFNIGRHEAFFDKGRAIGEGGVPSACALGTRQGDLVIFFLAGKAPGIAIENPRQTNAYRYPRDFGPKSPTFSRGILVGGALLISGTASIIGSETVHPENVIRQLDETLENLRLVIGQARECGFAATDPGRLFFNVYLRHIEDYPSVRSRLDSSLAMSRILFTCKLMFAVLISLLEIEAFWIPSR